MPVCNAKGIPAYIHPDDRPQLSDPWSWVGAGKDTPLYGRLEWTEPDDVKQLTDGETISLAGLDLRVDLAPGHTPGSVTFATPGPVGLGGDLDAPVLFSGDLLFQGVDRPHRPARWLVRADPASRWPGSSCRCPTRRWCCPATAPRRPSAASA